MILTSLILVLLIGGLLAALLARVRPAWARWTALVALVVQLVLGIALWAANRAAWTSRSPGNWIAEVQCSWMPRFGVTFHLGLDGLSLLLVMLTSVVGILAVAISWKEIDRRVGFFHLNLLWVLAGTTGVFMALDLFLFYFFWEMMLIPMYFLIAIWGHENRIYASLKFFLFTQASGLLMFLAIVGLAYLHYQQTGVLSYGYADLLATTVPRSVSWWMMLGFFAAFAVKLSIVPLHTWQPDAYTEAPTAGSVILSGTLVNAGAYGLLRFALPLFPDVPASFAPIAMTLGTISILYGALVAFSQTDLKRLVAYTSVSHMGFILLGVYAWNVMALQGAVMQIICHALSAGGLFIAIGMLQERCHTRDIDRLGGLWETMPRLGAATMIFVLASLGLPGLGNFVAEFLVLIGAYQAHAIITAIAALGLIVAAVYSLRIIQRVFHGQNPEHWRLPDLTLRELAIVSILVLGLVWLGTYPQPVLNTTDGAVNRVLAQTPTEPAVGERP